MFEGWNLPQMLQDDAAIRITSFVVVFSILVAWEAFAPRRHPRVGRERWSANLGLTILNTLLLRFAVPLGAFGAAEVARSNGWGLFNQTSWPAGVEIGIVIALYDLTIYWQHRLFHVVPFLWRFHKVHHADNDFDLTTGLRFHTVSMVLSMGVKMAVAVALGAAPVAVMLSELALNLTAMFNHANIRVPGSIDRWLRWLVVTPDMHRVHHSAVRDEHSRNFGFNFPWWDHIFGSYRAQPAAGHNDVIIGLEETQRDTRQTVFWLLALPFRRARRD